MANPCRERISANNTVDIDCSIDKCQLSRSDIGEHIIDITNRRPDSIYDVEIYSVYVGAAVSFNNNSKSITRHNIIQRELNSYQKNNINSGTHIKPHD